MKFLSFLAAVSVVWFLSRLASFKLFVGWLDEPSVFMIFVGSDLTNHSLDGTFRFAGKFTRLADAQSFIHRLDRGVTGSQ